MTPCPPCVDSERPRVYVENVPVCTGTTRTCFNTCARGAGIHGDVLNVHTEAFLKPNTGFSTFFQRAATHTQPNTHHDHQQHHDHNDTPHNTTERDRERETEKEHRERDRERETREDKRRQHKTRRQEKM